MLSLKQLQDVCLVHGGSQQCRYLFQDDNQWDRWYCKKKRPVEKAKIDKKADEMVAECLKKKVDPDKHGFPLGDNCAGYPVLKTVPQGYDVP
jgi:hypothetical protein